MNHTNSAALRGVPPWSSGRSDSLRFFRDSRRHIFRLWYAFESAAMINRPTARADGTSGKRI
jgi:hypothetical protein